MTNVEISIKKRSKELIPKMKQRGLRAITLQGALDKSTLQYWKNNKQLDSKISFFAFNVHQYYFRRWY